MKYFADGKRRLLSLMLVFALSVSTLFVALPPKVAHADENPIVAAIIDSAIERAQALINYAISYGLDTLADEVDDESFSAVVSFLDMFVWDTDETHMLEEIVEMCETMLKEINTIEERQSEYGSTMLNKIDSGQMLAAKQDLNDTIQKDINDQLVINGVDLTQVIEAYKAYLKACKAYNETGADYTAAKQSFETALDNILGGASKTDANRYETAIIGSRLHDVFFNLINNLYVGADSSQARTDMTVCDKAAQLAYMYFPWSQDQYAFVSYELDSQLTTIMVVGLIYEEYLARQYTYLSEHNLLEDPESATAANFRNNKANLYSDCGELAKRYTDLTEKDLSVSTGISLKLHQYFKTTDLYCTDISNNATIASPHKAPLCGNLLNENYKYEMWYDDEHNGYLQEDFADGGPLDGLDDDHCETTDKSDATGSVKAYYYTYKGQKYAAHHVYEYPVVRNGGIDMYYIDRYSMELHNLMERSSATWGWGDQAFPSMTFFNSYHGRFAPVDYYIWDDEDAFSEYRTASHAYYKMARELSEIKNLVNNPSFGTLYNGNLYAYLGLDNNADYLLFGKYRATDNMGFGGTGKIYLNMLELKKSYDYATIDTNGVEICSQDTLYPDTHGKDGLGDRTEVALYVPESAGQSMKTDILGASVKNADGTSGKVEISAVSGDTETCGSIVSLRFKPSGSNMIPSGLSVATGMGFRGHWYDIVPEGGLKHLSPDESGYYTVEAILPYQPTCEFRITLAKKKSVCADETMAEKNVNGIYLKNSKKELMNRVLTDTEKERVSSDGDARFALTGEGIELFPEETKEMFRKLAAESGYELSEHYMDLNLAKRINLGEYVNVTKIPGGEVTLALQLPETLRVDDGRDFKLLREHDGKLDVIDADYDKTTNELTFSTDRFSRYALLYRKAMTSGKLKYKKTGNNTVCVVGLKDKKTKKSIQKLVIPDTIKKGGRTYKVTEIQEGAFQNAKKLKSLTIGKNVERIGNGAFANVKELKTVTIRSKKLTKKNVKNCLYKSYVTKLKVPKSARKTYKKFLTKKYLGARGKLTIV